MSTLSNRREAREFALQFLYQLHLPENSGKLEELTAEGKDGESLNEMIIQFEDSNSIPDNEMPALNLSLENKNFAVSLIKGSLENYANLKELLLGQMSKKWKWENLNKSDASALIIGAFELNHEKTPSKVIISEALELGKKYGTNESSGFINGVLDGLNKKIR